MQKTEPIKVLEVITESGLNVIRYDQDKAKYLWYDIEDSSLLNMLTKHFPSDWWNGYPLYIHDDYKEVIARRINYTLFIQEDKDSEDVRRLLKGSIEAWIEQLCISWSYENNEFLF